MVPAESLTGSVDEGLRSYDAKRRRVTQRLAARSLQLNRLARVRRFTGARDLGLRVALAPRPSWPSWSADLERDEPAG
ncbi:hypothetical protein [Saccharothrix texasensis]|uniref:hypothetical protein n=1 Tax=Saccharothrix texasensis TaxID=103734 RepID=UPI000F4D2206|nr:hypothetical protein [Saccharothrix texasensis]